jgi:hypothetical protein
VVYAIYDDVHCELGNESATLAESLAELDRLARLRWDEWPNLAPCSQWASCGRRYRVVELSLDRSAPYSRVPVAPRLCVGYNGTRWLSMTDPNDCAPPPHGAS